MKNEYVIQFDKYWDSFVLRLKGQLIKRSKKTVPSVRQANMILKDCTLDFLSDDTQCGRWLMRYEDENPSQARLIKEIFAQDITFSKIDIKKEMPPIVQMAIPVVGLATGLVVSRVLGANLLMQAVSAAVPAVLLVPCVKTVNTKLKERNTTYAIQEYLQQLDKYYESIVSILEQ